MPRRFEVRAALALRDMTAAEVAAELGIPLRRAYRLLHAMREAGLPLEEGPDLRRSPKAGDCSEGPGLEELAAAPRASAHGDLSS